MSFTTFLTSPNLAMKLNSEFRSLVHFKPSYNIKNSPKLTNLLKRQKSQNIVSWCLLKYQLYFEVFRQTIAIIIQFHKFILNGPSTYFYLKLSLNHIKFYAEMKALTISSPLNLLTHLKKNDSEVSSLEQNILLLYRNVDDFLEHFTGTNRQLNPLFHRTFYSTN